MPPFSKFQEFDDSSPCCYDDHHSEIIPNKNFELNFYERRKSVSFDEDIEIINTSQTNESYDPSDIWLSRRELSKIKRGLRQILRRYEASMIGDDFDTGAVYVYRRSQDGWVQEAKLVADDTMDSPYEEFGHIVSIKGNIIVVGDEYYGQANKGAAYVFEYDAEAGSWIQIGSPITTDECELGYFGSSVGIMENGNLLISCNRDNGKTGAVYYFARSGAEYVMQQKIVASDGVVGDEFGGSFKTIAVDGDTAIIGTNKRERVYVFNLQDDVWAEVSYIDEPAGFDIVQFGSNLALSANRVLIRSSGNAYFYQLPLNKMFE